MKNTVNFYEQKKVKVTQPAKKTNFINTLIYKEITTHLEKGNTKAKSNGDSKELIKKGKEEKLIPSKKSSLNGMSKKCSKNNLSTFDIYHIYPKLKDNFMIETQEETRFQDTKKLILNKQKQQLTTNKSNELVKKSSKLITNLGQMDKTIKIQKSMFNYMYIIGKGGFGKVWKVQNKKLKVQYAMKQLLKAIVMTKKSVQSVINERVLLSQLNSPFIVNMHYAFQDRDTIYLVLDLMEGGDLRYHLSERRFKEIQTKFFVACIILGLEDLQAHSIIHRDLKPENLVLDVNGYIRITDLGIARVWKLNNASDTSGTPGYMSPEVICRMNHTFASDYFGLGVIAYELMTGRRPYNGRSRNQIRDLMLAKQVQLKESQLSEDWSPQAADFVNKLIKRKPENRLGTNGIAQIKGHPWLAGVNWQKLRAKQIQSPFIPTMNKSNFDQDEQITIEDEEQGEMIEKNCLLLRKPEFQRLFNGYYYERQSVIIEEKGGLKEQEKKNYEKRVISGSRKSAHQEKEIKLVDLIPDKKLSETFNKKKLDQARIQKNKDQENVLIGKVVEKKRSAQYEKTFFR